MDRFAALLSTLLMPAPEQQSPERVYEAPVLGEGEALRRHVALGALAGGAQHVPAARRHQLRAPQVDHLQLAAHKHKVWRLDVHVNYVSK